MTSLSDVFGDVIHTYTRADGMRDGQLVDVSDVAREAGFTVPVALTRAAWEDLVAWTPADDRRKPEFTGQDEQGRLWDVLWMGRSAIARQARTIGSDRLTYGLLRIPREGRGVRPRMARAVLHSGPGDQGEHVITIMLPDES